MSKHAVDNALLYRPSPNFCWLVAAGQRLPSHIENLTFQDLFSGKRKILATLEGLVEEDVRVVTRQSR